MPFLVILQAKVILINIIQRAFILSKAPLYETVVPLGFSLLLLLFSLLGSEIIIGLYYCQHKRIKGKVLAAFLFFFFGLGFFGSGN